MTRLLKTTLALGLALAAGTALPSLAVAGDTPGTLTGFSEGGASPAPARDEDSKAQAKPEHHDYRIVRPVAESAPAARHWHGDIRRFQQNDYLIWNRGRWFHGEHGSQNGWWWVVGDSWYPYATPTYPFPNPYAPADMIPDQQAAAAPSDATPPDTDTPPPAPQYWYYCEAPQGYYPYVASCDDNWEPVAPTP